ncbi:hypothetical protein BegalDRAFT_2515 [Beggiatoa alba B18LD]|uniref:Cytochrome c domain-containing protein n=1 Tax=Beggiatoa alba B18LD TaxID=395493 RepID=I3CIB5_9GAMM|nr:hypothetical protein [Beggiatoa alba]EIJ43358.1 hypothetical protein BegalDRAFT_2515 [Beggiatoa alba B18LD]
MLNRLKTHLFFVCLISSVTLSSSSIALATEQNPAPPTTTATSDTDKPKTQFPEGKALHDTNCVKCHQSMTFEKADDIYTRPERFVKSYDSLKTQIQRCVTNTDLMWFDEEIEKVANYLNEQYYHFEIKE